MRTRLKTAVFVLTLILLGWVAVEGFTFFAHRMLHGSFFTYRAARAELTAKIEDRSRSQEIKSPTELDWGDYVESLHPYFGFVADPERNRASWQVSDLGFVLNRDSDPLVPRSDGALTFAVFGGSFANGVYLTFRDRIEERVRAQGREVRVLNFSAAGYKQPQQLMILNYLQTLGVKLDFVVNVDGFNEVALPAVDNLPHGVNPFYPRSWDRRTAHLVPSGTLRLLGTKELCRTWQGRLATLWRTRRLYWSPTLFLVWRSADRALEREIERTDQRLNEDASQPRSWAMKGHRYTRNVEQHLYSDLADVWMRSSLQMNTLCAASGTRYFHFLQPNQYVEGSKPMSSEELRVAFNPGHPYRPGVVQGYPLLVKAGKELVRRGVPFFDLTLIFSSDETELYSDDCCHANSAGYAIITDAILQAIEPELQTRGIQ